jgi:glycosyltransferase involved in cell wall biosynthesis
MSDNINIIILGENYFGTMASAQRVRNLFEPLLNIPKIKISNIIINAQEFEIDSSKVTIKKLKYNYKNIFSILYYLGKGTRYIIKNYNKNELNIIYHYQYPSIEDVLFLKIAKIYGYKIVYDITENIKHYDLSNTSLRMKFKNYTSTKLLKQLYKNGSMCFAISTNLVDFCKTICNNKIPVIHLPISVNVEYVKKINKINKEKDRIQVFHGGSFGFKDGFEYLLKGFELACERNDKIELILTGKVGRQMEGKVNSLIASSKWKEHIKFLGYLTINEYFTAMVNADILCICRINSEFANYGFPFKLGEYLASGNAVIVTNIGDVPQYITNKENALLIQPESEYQICDAILMLAQDSQLRIKLGNAARESALKYFSSQKISKSLFENIQNLNIHTKERNLS